MQRIIDKTIHFSFYALFILVPISLYPKTSEIFEFNKIVVLYFITTFIVGTWLVKMVLSGKVVFRRTPLDLPLFIFLLSMGISWLFSVDPRTSFFGYYSRFNGGLLSLISYSLLYWAYVSNMGRRETRNAIFTLFVASTIASVWAIFEHFGRSFSCLLFPDFGVFDNSCWVQDVQNRVYSTFGQPNWLAAWLAAIIPLVWAFGLGNNHYRLPNNKHLNRHVITAGFAILALTLYITLLYTKSRSGLLAFVISFVIFWGYYLFFYRKDITNKIIRFVLFTASVIFLTIMIDISWSQTLTQYIYKKPANNPTPITTAPALESGGTESGTIRKIVWKGALDIWKAYPVFGTGLETFAFSYYEFKPPEHNLTSEWDFLYNKAHNEYLNFMATTGTIGILSYLLLIFISIATFIQITKVQRLNTSDMYSILPIALLSGYFAILVSNFFGFSTVSINMLFFIFPAFSLSLIEQKTAVKIRQIQNLNDLNIYQKALSVLIIGATIFTLNRTMAYWSSDRTYAYGKNLNDSGKYTEAFAILKPLTIKNPYEPTYSDELSNSYSNLAIYYSETGQDELAKKFADDSYKEMKKAMDLSPRSVTLKRKAATKLINMAAVNSDYLLLSKNILESAIKLAPTDAKLRYNLGLTYLRTGDYENAIKNIKETIILKPDYELAHYALALIYIDNGQKENAKAEFEYILREINPDNVNVKRELNELNL